MIEKLEQPKSRPCDAPEKDIFEYTWDYFLTAKLIPKINEMIDAINKLEQTKTTTTKCKNCGHHTDYGDGDCICEHEYGHIANHLDICQHYGNQNKHCQWFV